jgi:hypothetical protein
LLSCHSPFRIAVLDAAAAAAAASDDDSGDVTACRTYSSSKI